MFEELKTASTILKLSDNIKFITNQNLEHIRLTNKLINLFLEEIVPLKKDVALLMEFASIIIKEKEENNCNCEHKLKEKI